MRKRIPQVVKPKLDIRFAPVKKRLVEQLSSPPPRTPSPSGYLPTDEKKGMKSALRTRGGSHDYSVRFSLDESAESGRSLRKRTTVPLSYEELSDIDSDDESGSSRRRKTRSRNLRKDSEVNNNTDAGSNAGEGTSSSDILATDEENSVTTQHRLGSLSISESASVLSESSALSVREENEDGDGSDVDDNFDENAEVSED